MNRRILINLAAFAALGGILVFWALRNVITFDFIERPYQLTAEFSSSPGLHPDFEVAYLGVRVGKISSVRLRDRKVEVLLDIDKGIKIPRDVTAAAARKSAVGEPYVELTPAPGQGNAPALKPGAVIPVSQTSVPQTYGELFGAVNRAMSAIDPGDAGTLVHELAVGWDGRSESLRELIDGADQLTTTFANNSELLDGLTKDLTRITHTLAQHRGELGTGIDNLATLTASLRQVRGQLEELRDRGPDLLSKVNNLVAKTESDYSCMVDALGTTLPQLTTPSQLRNFRRIFTNAPPLVRALNGTFGEEQGEKFMNVYFVFTINKLAALEYKEPLAQPRAGKIPSCPDGRNPGVVKQKTPATAAPSVTQVAAGQAAPTTASADPVKNASAEAPAGPPAWLVYVPPLFALLVLIKVMAGAIPLPWRRRRP
jgi:phospholipid/cholesterol/gamma-HCH transport system substrate-binding protein